jgi:hypothetical protein
VKIIVSILQQEEHEIAGEQRRKGWGMSTTYGACWELGRDGGNRNSEDGEELHVDCWIVVLKGVCLS